MTTLNPFLQTAQAIARKTFGQQSEYHLRFNLEADNCWYIDFPGWPFSHHNLMMVKGADALCVFLSDESRANRVAEISVIPAEEEEQHPGYAKLIQKNSSLTGGSTYQVTELEGFDQDIWLCPVTLFVLGRYPKYLYIKKA